MKFSWSWLTPLLLRLLALSQPGLADASSSAETRSVHLVASFSLGLASTAAPDAAVILSVPSSPQTSSLQPRLRGLDSSSNSRTTDFLPLSSYELSLPIMPLHLLPKKSWHVYNTANVERVRRDEAAAAAREAAQEEQMQEEDAARRMAILRGEAPPAPLALPAPEDPSTASLTGKHPRDQDAEKEAAFLRPEKKKRKRWDENDTEYEMRLAQDTISQSHAKNSSVQLLKPSTTKTSSSDEPITDTRGHISLFPPEKETPNRKEKNTEAEGEAAQRQKEYEDQYTMRFSNAAGFKEDVGAKPWYLTGSASKTAPAPTTTDIAPDPQPSEREQGSDRGYDYMQERRKEDEKWGRTAPGSSEQQSRPRKKLVTSVTDDPLAMMKRGAAQVRQVERERKAWVEKREREMRDLGRVREDDELAGFSLGAPERHGEGEKRRERRHRDGSRDKDEERERRHHRHHHHHSSRHHRHHSTKHSERRQHV